LTRADFVNIVFGAAEHFDLLPGRIGAPDLLHRGRKRRRDLVEIASKARKMPLGGP